MRKPTFCLGKNKAVTAKLIRVFVFATQIIQFLFFLILKVPASSHPFCFACTVQFVSDLFGNHIVGFLTTRLIWLCIEFLLAAL